MVVCSSCHTTHVGSTTMNLKTTLVIDSSYFFFLEKKEHIKTIIASAFFYLLDKISFLCTLFPMFFMQFIRRSLLNEDHVLILYWSQLSCKW